MAIVPFASRLSPTQWTETVSREKQAIGLIMIAVLVAAIFLPGAALAQDEPSSVPAAYYGSVTINGEPAPVGTNITAEVDGTVHGWIEVSTRGQYGGPDAMDEKLVVRNAEAGDQVTFYVRGVAAEETVQWESGDVQEVNLTFTDVQESGDETTTTETTAESQDSTEAVTTTEELTGGQQTGGSQETSSGTTTEPGLEDTGEGQIVSISGQNPTVTVDSASSISRVEFESESNIEATVSVKEVTESPAPEPEGKSFVTGTEISFTDGNSDAVSKVRMAVRKTTVETAGVTASQLVLTHLDAETESWESLETSVVSETNEEIVLEAPSAGFSTYAVFAQEESTTTTQEHQTTTSTDTTTTESAQETTESNGTTVAEIETTDTNMPGFTVGLTILALLGGALISLRRR